MMRASLISKFLFIFLLWVALLSHVNTACATELPIMKNLQTDLAEARHKHQPLIILVHLPHCKFCKIIEKDHLKSLHQENKVLIRSIDLSSTNTLLDTQGKITTQREWARGMGVKVAPTVLALGFQGQLIAEPLIGSSLPDFYGSYLHGLLDQARKTLHESSQNPR
jgi:thioredoxin-related protein